VARASGLYYTREFSRGEEFPNVSKIGAGLAKKKLWWETAE